MNEDGYNIVNQHRENSQPQDQEKNTLKPFTYSN